MYYQFTYYSVYIHLYKTSLYTLIALNLEETFVKEKCHRIAAAGNMLFCSNTNQVYAIEIDDSLKVHWLKELGDSSDYRKGTNTPVELV